MNNNLELVLEALLFVVGDDGLSVDQICNIMEINNEDAKAMLNSIQLKYRSDSFSIELVSYGGFYKFLTKDYIEPYLKNLFNITKNNSLSQSALETLAIIAYKQPITRIEIEELRGVSCDMMLRKLCARNLIKEAGRSETAGRPILYEVTKEFMDSFKLLDLKELPDLPHYGVDEEANLFDSHIDS